MMGPETQENQITTRFHDPASYTTELGRDTTTPIPDELDSERASLRSQVEKTQFGAIEPSSQVQESSFYRPIVRPEPHTTADIAQGFRFSQPAKPTIGHFSYGRLQRDTTSRRQFDRVADSVPSHLRMINIQNEDAQPQSDALPTASHQTLTQTARTESVTKSGSTVDSHLGAEIEDSGFNQKKRGASVIARRSKTRQHSFSEVASTQKPKTRRHPFPEVANADRFDLSIETHTGHPDQLVNYSGDTLDVSAHPDTTSDTPLEAGPSGHPHKIAAHQVVPLDTNSTLAQGSPPVPSLVLKTTHQSNGSSRTNVNQDGTPTNSKRLSENVSTDQPLDFSCGSNPHLLSWLPSQTPPAVQSRSQSASNTQGATSRSLMPSDLPLHNITDSPKVHSYLPAKIRKSADNIHPARTPRSSSAGRGSARWNQERAEMIAKYPSFLEEVMKYKTIAEDYCAKDAYIEAQDRQIERLKRSEIDLTKQTEFLQAENLALEEKARKCKELSTKYKEHMNKVVQCQEMLATQAKDMRKVSSEAIAAYAGKKTAYAKNEAAMAKISDSLKTIKQMRLEVDKSVADEKYLLSSAQRSEKEISEKLALVLTEKQQLSVQLEYALKTNDLLKEDLQKNLIELSREQHRSEQLHLQFSKQLEGHGELVKLLREVPADIIYQLAADEGVLGRILASANATDIKFDQLATLVEELNSREPEPPSSLIVLINDLFKRLANELQASNSGNSSRQDCILKEFEDLKTRIYQLRSDAQTQNAISDQISKLRESNATIAADKSRYQEELQGLASQLDETRQDLNNYREQLAVKSRDLEVHLALPKEDPRHVAKIQELESANSSLHNQLDCQAEERSRAKEELRLVREELNGTVSQMEYLGKEKKELQESLGMEVEHAKRARMVDYEKLLKLSSTARNLKEMCTDKDEQLKSTKEELQKLRVSNQMLATTAEEHRSESALLEAQVLKTIESQERLESVPLDFNTEKRIIDLEVTGDEIRKLATRVIETRNSTDQEIKTLSTTQLELGDNIRKLKEENASLRDQIAELQARHSRPQRNTPLNMPPPPMVSNQKATVNSQSSPACPLSPNSQAPAEDDAVLRLQHECPKGAFRTALFRKPHCNLKSEQRFSHPTSLPQDTSKRVNAEQSSKFSGTPASQQPYTVNETPITQLSQDSQLSPWPKTNLQTPQRLTPKSSTSRASNRRGVDNRWIGPTIEGNMTTREVMDNQTEFHQWPIALMEGNRHQSAIFHSQSVRERETATICNDADIGRARQLAVQEQVDHQDLHQALTLATKTTPITRPPSGMDSTASTMSPLSDLEYRMYDLEQADRHTFDGGDNRKSPGSHTPIAPINSNLGSQGNNLPSSQSLNTPGMTAHAQGRQEKRREPNHRQVSNLKSALKSKSRGPTVNESTASALPNSFEISKLQPLLPNPTSQNKSSRQSISQGRSYKRVVEGHRNNPSACAPSYRDNSPAPQQAPTAGVPRRNRSSIVKRQSETDVSSRPSKILRMSLPLGGLANPS